MTSTASLILLAASLVLTAGGCKETSASTEAAASATQPVAAEPAAATKPATVTAKIVFIDMENGCACTQKRVAGGWSALQAALAGKATPPVERLHSDTETEKAGAYEKLRPLLTVPALYFIDGQGALIELLQGEVTTEQIQAVLGTGK
jgi:hypothetical protein